MDVDNDKESVVVTHTQTRECHQYPVGRIVFEISHGDTRLRFTAQYDEEYKKMDFVVSTDDEDQEEPDWEALDNADWEELNRQHEMQQRPIKQNGVIFDLILKYASAYKDEHYQSIGISGEFLQQHQIMLTRDTFNFLFFSKSSFDLGNYTDWVLFRKQKLLAPLQSLQITIYPVTILLKEEGAKSKFHQHDGRDTVPIRKRFRCVN